MYDFPENQPDTKVVGKPYWRRPLILKVVIVVIFLRCRLLSGRLHDRIIETRWGQFLSMTSPTVSRSSTLMNGWMNSGCICCRAKPSTQSSATKLTWRARSGQWHKRKVGGSLPATAVSTSLKHRQRPARTSRRCLPWSLVTFTACWSVEWCRSRRAGMVSKPASVTVTRVSDCECLAPGLAAHDQIAVVDDVEIYKRWYSLYENEVLLAPSSEYSAVPFGSIKCSINCDG